MTDQADKYRAEEDDEYDVRAELHGQLGVRRPEVRKERSVPQPLLRGEPVCVDDPARRTLPVWTTCVGGYRGFAVGGGAGDEEESYVLDLSHRAWRRGREPTGRLC